jgi:hypothetical protein
MTTETHGGSIPNGIHANSNRNNIEKEEEESKTDRSESEEEEEEESSSEFSDNGDDEISFLFFIPHSSVSICFSFFNSNSLH